MKHFIAILLCGTIGLGFTYGQEPILSKEEAIALTLENMHM